MSGFPYQPATRRSHDHVDGTISARRGRRPCLPRARQKDADRRRPDGRRRGRHCRRSNDGGPDEQARAALVDVDLPDGNGIALAHELTALPWRPRVVLTSVDAEAAGPDDVRAQRRACLRAQGGPAERDTPSPAGRRTRSTGASGCLSRRSAARRRRVLLPHRARAVRVVIGEDDVLLREGISRLLAEAGFDVVGAGR